MKHEQDWEAMGAGIGLLAALMFVLAFIVFMTTSPTGSPPLPSIENAQNAPAFLAAHLTAVRLVLLFTSLGIVLFLWFAGSLRAVLRQAEGEPARGSALAMAGATAGGVLMLAGLVLGFAAGLSTSPLQASAAPALYTASALLFDFGGGTLSLFFFAAAQVILRTGALGRWLGWLALIAGLLAVLAFMTPFFPAGVLNAATGALGRWAWLAGLVVWLFLASLMLAVEERRLAREAKAATAPARPVTGAQGAVQ
jgi:hypothetical protein